MRKFLKWTAIVFAVLLVGVIVVAVMVRAKMKGPDLPQCSAPAPARGKFETPQLISGPGRAGTRQYDIEPSAALLPDGALAIVYNTRDSMLAGTSGLATAYVPPSGGPIEVREYSTDRKESFDAWMARASDGKTRMVWLAHDGGSPEKNMKIGYSESADGKTWSAPGSAHAPADCPEGERGCMDKPMIATSTAGVHVFYYSQVQEGLRAATAPLGSSKFETSVEAGDGAYADVEVSRSGAIHVVYMTSIGEGEQDPFGSELGAIAYRRSDDGGKSFAPAIIVSEKGEKIPFFFSNPQVASDDARGHLYVAYPSGGPDGRWDIRLATSNDGGKTWAQRIKVNDDPPCANHMTPHSALDPRTGILHLTWLENRSGTGALVYASCEPGGAKCSANESASAAPFASYTFERHLSAWLSEYGALVLDADRGILHAVWTQPVLEHGSAISRIFYARAKL